MIKHAQKKGVSGGASPAAYPARFHRYPGTGEKGGMMMKKIALLLLVMLLSLNMVFASGSTEASADAGTEGTKIVLFQHKTEIYDQLEAMAEAYEAETGVEVEVWRISGNDYYTNLTTYMSSGAGPTVFTLRSDAEINEMSPYLSDLGDLDVTSRINSELRGVVDGKTIGIPMTAEGFGFIYNKELVSTDDLASMDSLISFMEECAENGITGVGLSQESRFLIGQILNFPFALQPDPIDFCQRLYAGEIELADVPEFQDFARLFEAIRSIQKNPLEVSYDNCNADANVLNQQTNIDVYIEGHTDSKPIHTTQFKDNWDLSVVRATSVVRILTEEYEVNPLQILPCGRGEHMPVADNETAEGRARNRRTEIIMAPKLDELYKLLNTTDE